ADKLPERAMYRTGYDMVAFVHLGPRLETRATSERVRANSIWNAHSGKKGPSTVARRQSPRNCQRCPDTVSVSDVLVPHLHQPHLASGASEGLLPQAAEWAPSSRTSGCRLAMC